MTKSPKFENEEYRLHIVGKHLEVTDAMHNYVWGKLLRVEKIADHIIDVTVTLNTQKLEHSCAIVMNFIHFHVKAHATTDNIYSAIDKTTDRLVRLVRKYKEKLQSYRAKDVSSIDIHVNVIDPLHDEIKIINEEIEAETARQENERFEMHKVVDQETMSLKMLTQDEAIMKMEITNEPFMIYRSEEDQKLKLLYRRKDENYSLVHVQ